MEDSVETIREATRNILIVNRRKNRNKETDFQRSMENLRINPDTVLNIANKMKTKSAITVSDLQILKNALIEDATNIQIVLNTNGALRGLVRELTGSDVNKQCAAAGCCCNVAVGGRRAARSLARAAGAYLAAALHSLATDLAVTSAWTLGNLANSGPRACELLSAQGAVNNLLDLAGGSDVETRDAAIYALVRFAHQLNNDLRTEHLHRMLRILHACDIGASSRLLFVISCHRDFTPELVSLELLSKILQYLSTTVDELEDENVTYLFRFLANSASKELCEFVLSFLLNSNLLNSVKMLVDINESVLWFIGNAFKLCSDNVFFEDLFK